MTYFVYENWTNQRAVIHRAECGHCNHGAGRGPGSSGHHGRWHGPFDDETAATSAAKAAARTSKPCGHCMAGPPIASAQRRSRARRTAVDERVEALIADFGRYVKAFDRDRPFTAEKVRLHLATLAAARRHSSVASAAADPGFIELLHQTLEAWGMSSRGARLAGPTELGARIRASAGRIERLATVRIEELSTAGAAETASEVWALLEKIRASRRESNLVASSKALHHLLPGLLPPIDHAYTLRFFGRQTLQRKDEKRTFLRIYAHFHRIAVDRKDVIVATIGRGMHTSVTKVIDNAIVGYVRTEMPTRHQA